MNKHQHLYGVHRTRIAEPENIRLRLQRNEKPDAWPQDFQKRILASMPVDVLQQYPNTTDFYRKLSAFLDVSENNLLLASGVDETIKTIIMLACEPHDSFSVTQPGYAMYDVYARVLDVTLRPIVFQPDKFLPASEMLAGLSPDIKVLFLPNPGQPVENCYDLRQLREIAQWCRKHDVLFAVDEAYHFFGAPSALPLIQEFDNVLIMRTFSKAFGAASLRLGYVAGSEASLKPLSAFRLAYETNSFSLHIASVMLDSFDGDIKPSIRAIAGGRDYLRQECTAHGIPAWGENANYVLIDLGAGARMKRVAAQLESEGIYVKHGFPAPLDHHILVTCGSPAMMQEFFRRFHMFYKSAE